MKKIDRCLDRRPLTQDDYRVLAEFRSLLRQFLLFSERAAADAGIKPQQHQALLAIKGGGGACTVGDLAAQLAIRHHSAVGLANRLVGAKLLRRSNDNTDRRRVILALTPSAEDLLEILTATHRNELRKFTPLLKPLLAYIDG